VQQVRRVWGLLNHAAKPILWLAGFIAATLVIWDAGSSVVDSLRWREKEYDKLTQIHAGSNLAFVQELLGEPAFTRKVAEGFEENIFIGRGGEYVVQAVTDGVERVRFFSVTSCNEGFQPSFTSGWGTVTLQDRPMSEAAAFDIPPELARATSEVDRFGNNRHRVLNYLTGSTISTPEHYVETWQPSNASGNRTYFVAVNPLCLASDQYVDWAGAGTAYTGGTEEAPAAFRDLRQKYSANTYAELDQDTQSDIDDNGWLVELGAPIGASGFDLPPGVVEDGRTRMP
jgi:hypothetical protein